MLSVLQHYGIWNDTYITYPDGETLEGGLNVPEGFHGSGSNFSIHLSFVVLDAYDRTTKAPYLYMAQQLPTSFEGAYL